LRGLLTIGLSIACTYGVAVIYFQRIEGKMIFWMVPIMSFSIMVGLGLDYDIFLISRIVEYRALNFYTSASVVKGVYKTGSIITGAGIIMAIAFSALSFSKVE